MGPGLLVAATGVGAGDLATSAFTGIHVGSSVIWLIFVGALFKYLLNEGLMRFQLGSGKTFLTAAKALLPSYLQKIFLLYFFLWCYLVAVALMSACGVVLYAIIPFQLSPYAGKIVYGIFLSLLSLLLVLLGGYQAFQRIMKWTILLMFLSVFTITVFTIDIEKDLLEGLFMPILPIKNLDHFTWSLALLGGVGGTVTILNYGYWLQEEGRTEKSNIAGSRKDLAFAYIATAVFGMCMLIIGSHINVEGKGAGLIVNIGNELAQISHSGIKWIFFIGAFGAVMSSMLGVWQGVPYLFADMVEKNKLVIDSNLRSYKYFLIGLAIIPMTGLYLGFSSMQKLYALIGALFIPMLAAALLYIFYKDPELTDEFKFKRREKLFLLIILLFFFIMFSRTIFRLVG